jgi:PAS domain S-box-containing protein
VRIVTIEGETIYANRAILDIYGYDSMEDLKTTPVEKRYTPESHADFLIRREKRQQGVDVPSEYTINIIRKDGEVRCLRVLRREILWDGERQFQVLYIDITDHKRAEEERERLLAEIAAKNQELESFVYTISHDLRAPLVSMDGFYSLLKRESQDQLGEQGQHYLERIRANVAHMNTLVTELLELSRIGRVVGPEEEIEVGVLLREIEKGLVLKLEQEGVEFIVQQPLPAVRGDRGRIRQVFANLIENAVKFRSLERGLCIEVGCEEERGFYRFHVRDNGIGILPQYQEQIFEPFRQLDRRIEGVGMGLALVKRIVAYHRGRFWVESELGKGSTFYFTIPGRT